MSWKMVVRFLLGSVCVVAMCLLGAGIGWTDAEGGFFLKALNDRSDLVVVGAIAGPPQERDPEQWRAMSETLKEGSTSVNYLLPLEVHAVVRGALRQSKIFLLVSRYEDLRPDYRAHSGWHNYNVEEGVPRIWWLRWSHDDQAYRNSEDSKQDLNRAGLHFSLGEVCQKLGVPLPKGFLADFRVPLYSCDMGCTVVEAHPFDKGLLVTAITPKGSADQASLRKGDRLLRLEAVRLTSVKL